MSFSIYQTILNGTVNLITFQTSHPDPQITFENACWLIGVRCVSNTPHSDTAKKNCRYCFHGSVDFSFENRPAPRMAGDGSSSSGFSGGIQTQFLPAQEIRKSQILCRLLGSELCDDHSSQPFENCLQGLVQSRTGYAFDSTKCLLPASGGQTDSETQDLSLVIVLHPGSGEQWQQFMARIFHPDVRLTIQIEPSTNSAAQIPSLFRNSLQKDCSRLKISSLSQWLNECRSRSARDMKLSQAVDLSTSFDMHEGVCNSSRVIDITAGCLINAPRSCKYVALSYVWGKGHSFIKLVRDLSEQLHWPGGISLNDLELPRTIKDAMWVCSELGERYLWVDALCIIQDIHLKHNELQSMESIFRGAVVTLVAANGANANAGLHGVRVGSPFLEQDRYESICGLQTREQSVNWSIWNERAWTYQERVLSQRLVFFTIDGLLLQCRHGKFRPDASATYCAGHSHPEQYPDAENDYKFQFNETVNFTTYARTVAEYSKRKLSYEEDILHAFNGLEKLVDVIFSGEDRLCTETIFGLPISALDISLLWYPLEDLKPRSYFPGLSKGPSWSWSGWIGPVYYPDARNISEQTRSCVRWCDPSRPANALPGDWFGRHDNSADTDENWERRVSLDGDIYYIKKALGARRWFCHPVSYRFIHDPVPINRERGYLHLAADISRFFIRQNSSLPHTFSVVDDKGFCAGVVFADSQGLVASNLGKVQFIKLSQTNLYNNEHDPARDKHIKTPRTSRVRKLFTRKQQPPRTRHYPFDEEVYDKNINWCLYNVIMVVGCDDGTMSRVGIGKIHIHAFDARATRDVNVVLS